MEKSNAARQGAEDFDFFANDSEVLPSSYLVYSAYACMCPSSHFVSRGNGTGRDSKAFITVDTLLKILTETTLPGQQRPDSIPCNRSMIFY